MLSSGVPLKRVRAMRAEADDVLHVPLVLVLSFGGLVFRVLQAEARKFRGRVVDHQRMTGGFVIAARQVGVVEAEVLRTGVEQVVAVAGAPARHELVYALRVAAVLGSLVHAKTGPAHTPRTVQAAAFYTPERLGDELEVMDGGVAQRCPYPDEVRQPGLAVAGEGGVDGCAGEVGEFASACIGAGRQIRDAPALVVRIAHIAADVAIQSVVADAVRIA